MNGAGVRGRLGLLLLISVSSALSCTSYWLLHKHGSPDGPGFSTSCFLS